MDFKTHTTEQIDISGEILQGSIKASYAELCKVFGPAMKGDSEKTDVQWLIRFGDGTIATIYTWEGEPVFRAGQDTPTERIKASKAIKEWSVSGHKSSAYICVQVAIDLHREAEQGRRQKTDKVQAAFEPAFDVMKSIEAKKGTTYAAAIEIGILSRKQGELFATICHGLTLGGGTIPEEAVEKILSINAEIGARILSKSVGYLVPEVAKDKAAADEYLDWVDRMVDLESAGADALFKEFQK